MEWGQVIFATLTPIGVAIVGLLLRLSARLAVTERDARDAKHDVRDLYKRLLPGHLAPSEERERRP